MDCPVDHGHASSGDDRDIDLYHWSSTRFSRAWFDSLSVLVARGRAKVSAAAAASDWPRRILDTSVEHPEAPHCDLDGLEALPPLLMAAQRAEPETYIPYVRKV